MGIDIVEAICAGDTYVQMIWGTTVLVPVLAMRAPRQDQKTFL